MSIRRLAGLIATCCALGSVNVAAAEAQTAPAPATPTAADPSAEGEAEAPAAATAGQATTTPDAPPEGMVFDPTTGRYMPVAEQLPWRNSFFIFDNSLNHTTLDNSTLSDTDYWIQTYSLRPRWNFTDTLSLRVRQDIYAELVADSVSSEHQPVVLDTQIDLVEASLATVEGVILGVGARALLPVSLASRNANRVLGTGAQSSATKVFPDVLAGLVTQASIGYAHWWATSHSSTSYDAGAECLADNNLIPCTRFATPTSVRDQITAGLVGQINFTPELSAGLVFSWWWQRGADLDPVNLDGLDEPGVTGTLEDGSATHWRNLTVSSLFVAYQLNTWVQASIGINTLSSQLNPNGSLRNPFWNPDTQYSLTAVITLDQLYTTLVGAEETPPAHARRSTPQRL